MLGEEALDEWAWQRFGAPGSHKRVFRKRWGGPRLSVLSRFTWYLERVGARGSGGPPQSHSCQATKELCGLHPEMLAKNLVQRTMDVLHRVDAGRVADRGAQLPLPAVFKGLVPAAFSAAHPGCHAGCSVPVEMRADVRMNIYGMRAVCSGRAPRNGNPRLGGASLHMALPPSV